MQFKNSLSGILLLLTISGFTLKTNEGMNAVIKRWVVSQTSNLSVNGSTNVNKFTCVIPACPLQDTLTVTGSAEQAVVLSGRIKLPVSSFDCHISPMTRQLRETLKEKQFPVLYIRFLSLSQLPVMTAAPAEITGLVDIEIAGISKRFEVAYQLSQDAQQIVHLRGTRVVNFSDFNLIPPTKLGGMIKTRDALSVDFQLNMKEL
ncbi:YceI family protein [Mucilaginibacter sp. SMC90]|uniref:YceI family protein n=1 Tax=Mucilaginibacter sp. SMC90 TaxID=2929803 RepID=UPI001FB3EACE|nr:YceI family protein [Mucilaginibacter sp. SMC90]UOE49787.1 YceI family protein [Mucilaginibacter sp. SMC90]